MHESDGDMVHRVQPALFAAREIRVLAPEMSQLPSEAAEAIDAIVERDGEHPGVPFPVLMEGNAFLAQRARIATSLFAAQRGLSRLPALERLRRLADEELIAIERDFARALSRPPRKDRRGCAETRARGGARSRRRERRQTPTSFAARRVDPRRSRSRPSCGISERRPPHRPTGETRTRRGAPGPMGRTSGALSDAVPLAHRRAADAAPRSGSGRRRVHSDRVAPSGEVSPARPEGAGRRGGSRVAFRADPSRWSWSHLSQGSRA